LKARRAPLVAPLALACSGSRSDGPPNVVLFGVDTLTTLAWLLRDRGYQTIRISGAADPRRKRDLVFGSDLSPRTREHVVALYDSEIFYVDQEVGTRRRASRSWTTTPARDSCSTARSARASAPSCRGITSWCTSPARTGSTTSSTTSRPIRASGAT
jgi:hypothetical protein